MRAHRELKIAKPKVKLQGKAMNSGDANLGSGEKAGLLKMIDQLLS